MNTYATDAELIVLLDRVAAQDPVALKALYDGCASKFFGLALRVAGQREWAEDVLQEAFLSIWRSAGDYRASLSPPMAWMSLIVRSRALDLLRRRKAERSHVTQDIDEELGDTLAGNSACPLDTAQASEQARALHHCLVQLENRQREVVSLAYIRDLSHGELSEQMGGEMARLQGQLLATPHIEYVAVLSNDKQAASMLVTFDAKNKKLLLQRVGGFHEPGDRSLQLWALPPTGGPKSLGVLGTEPLLRLTALQGDVREVPTLAISLEPKGGVPSAGGPTGPVLFKGALIQKML